jgi:hypothetical protein
LQHGVERLRVFVLPVVVLGLVSAFIVGPSVSPASADYPATVLADHPVSYWRLNDSSGSTAVDQMGLNPGQITGATLGEPGPFAGSGSMRFEGNGDVNLGTDPTLRPPNNWTVEAWFKASASDTANCVNTYHSSGCALYAVHAFGLHLDLDPQGHVFGDFDSTSAQGYSVESPGTYGDNTWHYIVLVRETAQLRLYIDGSEVAATAVAEPTTYYCCENIATIANDDACRCAPFTGWESEVAFYNYPLSAARIAAHYAAVVRLPPTSAQPSDQPLTGSALAQSGAIFNPRTGVALVQEAWEFTDVDPGAVPSDFSASIDWGDGNTSAGQVSQTCLGQSCFFVAGGTHAYQSTGTFTATVHVRDNGGRHDSGGSSVAIPATIVVTQLLSLQDKQALARFADLLRSNSGNEAIVSVASVLGIFSGPFALPIGVLGGIAGADSYTKGQQADQLSALAADPPDPNFRAIVSPVLAKRIAVARAVPAKLRRLLQAWLDNGRQETALFKALLVSLERAQGASAAANGEWTLRQMTSAAGYALGAATALRDEATLLSRLRTALAHIPRWNPMLSARQARRAQRLVKSRGLPPAVKRILRMDGATAADLAGLRAALIATPARKLAGRVFSQLTSPSRIAKLASLAHELSDYAAQIA